MSARIVIAEDETDIRNNLSLLLRLEGFTVFAAPNGRHKQKEVTTMKKFWSDEEGLTTVEYALLLALIAIMAVAALVFVGGSITSVLSTIGKKL